MRRTAGTAVIIVGLALSPSALAGVTLNSASRSVAASAHWSDLLGDNSGGSGSQTIGPVTTLGTFDATAVGNAPDTIGGGSGGTVATAYQNTFLSPTDMHGTFGATIVTLGPSNVDTVSYTTNVNIAVEFDLTTPTQADIDVAIDDSPYSTELFIYTTLSRVGGGFTLAANDDMLTNSYSGMLPAGSYTFTVSMSISMPDGGFDNFIDTANSGSFDIQLIPAPGAWGLLGLAGCAAARRRR